MKTLAAAIALTTALGVLGPGAIASNAPEYGTPLTMGTFIRQCENETRPSPLEPGLNLPCQAYVVGYLESSGLLEYETKTGPRYCLPVEVSPGMLVAQLLEAGRRPDLEDYPVAVILRGMLEAKFPCPAALKKTR